MYLKEKAWKMGGLHSSDSGSGELVGGCKHYWALDFHETQEISWQAEGLPACKPIYVLHFPRFHINELWLMKWACTDISRTTRLHRVVCCCYHYTWDKLFDSRSQLLSTSAFSRVSKRLREQNSQEYGILTDICLGAHSGWVYAVQRLLSEALLPSPEKSAQLRVPCEQLHTQPRRLLWFRHRSVNRVIFIKS